MKGTFYHRRWLQQQPIRVAGFVIPCLQSAGGGFDIRYSLFQSFFFDLTGRFFASGGADTRNHD
jgi:hypothetical protein